jgi:transposase InsO family protein
VRRQPCSRASAARELLQQRNFAPLAERLVDHHERCVVAPAQHYFIDAAQARSALRAWQEDYNNFRPHSTLGNQTPAQFRAGQEKQPDRSEAAITRV